MDVGNTSFSFQTFKSSVIGATDAKSTYHYIVGLGKYPIQICASRLCVLVPSAQLSHTPILRIVGNFFLTWPLVSPTWRALGTVAVTILALVIDMFEWMESKDKCPCKPTPSIKELVLKDGFQVRPIRIPPSPASKASNVFRKNLTFKFKRLPRQCQWSTLVLRVVEAHDFSPCSREAKAGESFWVSYQPSLHS